MRIKIRKIELVACALHHFDCLLAKRLSWIAVLTLLAASQPSYAQTDSLSAAYPGQEVEIQPFDSAKWAAITRGIDYSQDMKTLPPEPEPEAKQFDPESVKLWSQILKIVLIITGIGLLTFLIIRFMGAESLLTPKDRKLSSADLTFELLRAEENLTETDLQNLLLQAIAGKDFILATRLQYLAAIKSLASRKLITRQREKTNTDYLSEIQIQALQAPFREITQIFERTWYGDFPLTVQEFESVRSKFAEFHGRLGLAVPKVKAP
jgi:hypothetical protein